MKKQHAVAHMLSSKNYAALSSCIRKKVGCVIFKDDKIISIGYNGTPPGWNNCCEDEHGNTLPEVIHAESNAIDKLAKTTGGGMGASVFVTVSPCFNCAIRLGNIGIKELYYAEEYRNYTEGLNVLRKFGIPFFKIDLPTEQK